MLFRKPKPALVMFMDAASGLDWPAKLDAIRVILSDLPPDDLERFSNEVGREAHMNARSRAERGGGVFSPSCPRRPARRV